MLSHTVKLEKLEQRSYLRKLFFSYMEYVQRRRENIDTLPLACNLNLRLVMQCFISSYTSTPC